jgi:hypothetical protein
VNEISSENSSATGTGTRTRSFRRWQPNVTLSPDQAKRQSAVLRYACHGLPSRDATVAFLNTYNSQLDGVPLHLALESEEGLVKVQQILMKRKVKREPAVRLGAAQ